MIKPKLLGIFVDLVTGGIVIMGYLFNDISYTFISANK
jgi:hypothetical protein